VAEILCKIFKNKRKARDKIEVKLGFNLCSCQDCEKHNLAMLAYNALKWWGHEVNWESLLKFDRETQEILIDEKGLMRLIMLINPTQKERKIKLIGGE